MWREFNGHNQRELARKFGVTVRYIYQILARQRGKEKKSARQSWPCNRPVSASEPALPLQNGVERRNSARRGMPPEWPAWTPELSRLFLLSAAGVIGVAVNMLRAIDSMPTTTAWACRPMGFGSTTHANGLPVKRGDTLSVERALIRC